MAPSNALIYLRKFGAGEGIRTLNPNLGKVVLEGIRTLDPNLGKVVLYP